MKAYQQATLRAERDPTVCEWGSYWDQLQQEHMCLAKIHFYYKMKRALCQNCPEWCWNICGVPQGFVIGTLRLCTSIHTVHVIFGESLFFFSLPFFCVQEVLYWVRLIEDTQKQVLFVLYINLYFRQLPKAATPFWLLFLLQKHVLCFHSSSHAPVWLQGLHSREKIIGDISNRSDCQRVFWVV